jgi:hypothetical protein
MRQVHLVGLVLGLGACTPVQPVALTLTANTPRVVWVLDASGSVVVPTDPSSPDCPSGCGPGGPACPPACSTRKSELLAGLARFSSLPTSVLHTAVIYPSDTTCAGPTTAQPNLALADVITAYAQHTPAGGTPTWRCSSRPSWPRRRTPRPSWCW